MMQFYLISRWVELAVIGTFLAALLLLVYRIPWIYRGLRRTWGRILATLYGIVLNHRHPVAIMRIELALLGDNLLLLGYCLPLIGTMAALVLLCGPTLTNRYGYRPLQAGEEIVVRVENLPSRPEVSLARLDGDDVAATVQLRAMVFDADARTCWMRIRPMTPGIFVAKDQATQSCLFNLNVDMPTHPAMAIQHAGEHAVLIQYPADLLQRWHGGLLWTAMIAMGGTLCLAGQWGWVWCSERRRGRHAYRAHSLAARSASVPIGSS